ncbi:MAG: chorismate mutase [Oscillospiraceae bacterium]
MELSDYRQQIDGIDSQLLALFYQRMEVAAQIAGYKKRRTISRRSMPGASARSCSRSRTLRRRTCANTPCRSTRSSLSSAAAARTGCSASRVR